MSILNTGHFYLEHKCMPLTGGHVHQARTDSRLKSTSIAVAVFPLSATLQGSDLWIRAAPQGLFSHLVELFSVVVALSKQLFVLWGITGALIPQGDALLVDALTLLEDAQPVVQAAVALEADAVPVAVALVHVRAELEVAREDVLPAVLQQPARVLVVQIRAQDPVTVAHVEVAWPLHDAVARHGELGAARLGDGRGDGHVGAVQLVEERRSQLRLFRLVLQVPPPLRPVHVQPVRAARVQVAARVEIALPHDVCRTHQLDGLGRVDVQEDVVVPGMLVWVEEKHHVR